MDRLIEARRMFVARVELQLFKPASWWRRLFRWLTKWRQPMATIKLGDKVRENITGFQGIAIARTSWLHGCDRITIQPDKLDKDGKPYDAMTFDEQQVELVKAQPVKVSKQASNAPGGPRRDPGRSRTPSRGR